MRKLFVAFSVFMACQGTYAASTDAFETELAGYVAVAKEISKKQISEEDETKLVSLVSSILENMKKTCINEKLQAESFALKYQDGREFPIMEEHQNSQADDVAAVKFTIACNALYKLLTNENIVKIIQKSPLEMVSVLREISAFLEFVSANPNDYGHGVLSDKDGTSANIFATNDAIVRIMKPIMYKRLLAGKKIVYKLSRLMSAFYRDYPEKAPQEIFDTVVASLKRNAADDARVSVFVHRVSQ